MTLPVRQAASETTIADRIDVVPTWNVCPSCGHRWTEKVPLPGVVHRTMLCLTCRRLARAEGAD